MLRHVALAAAVLSAAPAFADDELATVDRPAPSFRLPVYNPKESGELNAVGVDKFTGPDAADKKTKVLIVSFMASFCGPCKKEMPYLEAQFEKNKDKGLRILMVSIDKEEEGQKKVADLLVQNKVTFPVLKDRFNIVARRWLGTQSPLPSLFMVKPDGVVSVVHRGYSDDISATLAKEIDAALAAK